ncbi:MAG: helix-turn-helix domain-containing protein [Phycisphaeraceae bacterium]
MKQSLSPKELAQAIGVSESSLKRWTDSGRVRASRTIGGHRRIHLQEALRFIRESSLPVVRPELLGLPELGDAEQISEDVSHAGEMMLSLLSRGELTRARGLALNLYLSGHSLAWVCDGPLSHAMSEIGKIWETQQEGIFTEHRATEMCTQIVSQLRVVLEPSGELEQESRPVAVGGCPAGDAGALSSMMAAATLAECGYSTTNLGGNTPVDALLEALSRHEPRLVFLACPHQGHLPKGEAMETLSERMAELGGCVVVGGYGAEREFRASLPNVFLHRSMSELSAFARGLLAVPRLDASGPAAVNGHSHNGHGLGGGVSAS